MSPDELEVLIHPPIGLCPNCGEVMRLANQTCPECKAIFGPMSAWKIRALDDAAILFELKSAYLSGKKPTANQIRHLVAASVSEKSLISLIDQQKYGSTLLHWCAHFNLMDEAKLLLENGANAKVKNSLHQMPYEWCEDAALSKLLMDAALVS